MELTAKDKTTAALRAVMELPPAEVETTHAWEGGVYQRGLHVPAGVAVVGRVHKHAGLLTLVKGTALFYDGREARLVKAPWACVGIPGTRRVTVAVTPCYFISFVETDEQDTGKIEADTVEEDPPELTQLKGYLCHSPHRLATSPSPG